MFLIYTPLWQSPQCNYDITITHFTFLCVIQLLTCTGDSYRDIVIVSLILNTNLLLAKEKTNIRSIDKFHIDYTEFTKKYRNLFHICYCLKQKSNCK